MFLLYPAWRAEFPGCTRLDGGLIPAGCLTVPVGRLTVPELVVLRLESRPFPLLFPDWMSDHSSAVSRLDV